MSGNRTYETTFELNELEELFVAPSISPLSERYRPHSYTSVVEFVTGELHANTSYDNVKVKIVLPPDEAARAADLDISEAVARYSAGRFTDIEQDRQATLWRGLRVLIFALIALSIFLGLSDVAHDHGTRLGDTLGEGLVIAGWVMMWIPIEMLSIDLWNYRLDKKIYTMVSNMDVAVEVPDRS